MAIAAVVLLMAGTGLTVWLLTRTGSAAGETAPAAAASSPVAASSPAARASSSRLDEHGACNVLVPLLRRTVDILGAEAQNQPWDRGEAERVLVSLQGLKAPTDMTSDIGIIANALAGILNGIGYDGPAVTGSATKLLTRCRKYGT